MNSADGTHLKLKLLKAKLIALKAPHIAAKIATAKEVKAKTAIAAIKTAGAVSKIRNRWIRKLLDARQPILIAKFLLFLR